MLLIGASGNFQILSAFGKSTNEGTNTGQSQGQGLPLNFSLIQTVQLYESLYWQIEPSIGQASDFWDSGSIFLGGAPHKFFPSGFGLMPGSSPFRIRLNADNISEPDEIFYISFYESPTDPGFGVPALVRAQFTILDDDTIPPSMIGFSGLVLPTAEGNSVSTASVFTVTRSGDLTGTAAVTWAVAGSGANPANAADFAGGALPSGSVSFAAGETSKTINVNVTGDISVELDEVFTITLSGATGATIGAATAAGTITNDDLAVLPPVPVPLPVPVPVPIPNNGSDMFRGSGLNDALVGGTGNDSLEGGAGDDILDGGDDNDVAIYNLDPGALRIRMNGTALTVEAGTEGNDTLNNIEFLRTNDGSVELFSDFSGLFRQSLSGDNFMLLGTRYSGPVTTLERQLFGTGANEVYGGTRGHDFMNLFAGDDAANGGAGNDVIDGGLGSNFLSGGAGRDTFFSDGRGGGVTWTTITDWEVGEQLSVWGWRPGVSRIEWVDSDGVGAFKGVTMRGDLNGDRQNDTIVTWTGKTRADLPTPVEFNDLLWFIG